LRKVTFASESWPIAGTFTIARGSKIAADVVVVTITENNVSGHGEAVPYPRYSETVPQALASLESFRAKIEATITRAQLNTLNLPKAAQNALDCALWDLEAKQSGIPAWTSAKLQEPKPAITAFTLSLDTPEKMAMAATAASGRPLLKLKLGREGDVERLNAIREAAPDARLIVDANEGWTPATLPVMLAACEKYRVELVEQPLPAGDDEALRNLPHSTIICADESAHGRKTLHELKGKYDAINIKLDKTGGLTEALALAHEARNQGFKIMVGCMLATSLAMAPAFLLAQMADYIDLDGPLLLARDRSPGFTFQGSLMLPPPRELWG
jgi:L-alanine-DL-glutamate epimerase-like enolase superfamily enzyme